MAEGEHARGWWIAFGAVAALAVVVTVLAYSGRLPPRFFEADKHIHFAAAGMLAFTLDRATRGRSLRWPAMLLVLFAVDEIAQRLSVHRSSTFGDYAADVAGVVAFTALSRVISKARRAKPA